MPHETITAQPRRLKRLFSRKAALAETLLDEQALDPLGPGDALLAIRRLALTTNNITYAAFGDAMQYWQFFPTGRPEWGAMPVWGFADVLESNVEGVAVGERFYGYFPIANLLRVQPGRVTDRGFYDEAPHRRELTSAYNQYTRCSADAAYRADAENLQILLRPLFITSFMLADFLQDNAFFGARQIVVSSASSKTAYGTAFCLQQPALTGAADGAAVERIALTSGRNLAFVDQLGCYGRVLDYGALATLDAGLPTLYVDFSGDEALRERIHRHFGAALVHDCYAGSAQNPSFLRETSMPGPAPQFFFAPVQIAKRNKDWGYGLFNQRFKAAQEAFYGRVSDPRDPWLTVREHQGLAAAPALVDALYHGRLDPKEGQVVVPD
jgi:hypothetical protein